MRKLFFLFFAAMLYASCSNSKGEKSDNEDPIVKEGKKKGGDEETSSEESSLGNWSDADKNKLKKEWAKTFSKWKDGLQGEDGFDEADFDKESKKVVNCTLKVLENKFESYAAYKKANDKDHFQSDPELLTEMGDCTEALMQKYNREEGQ